MKHIRKNPEKYSSLRQKSTLLAVVLTLLFSALTVFCSSLLLQYRISIQQRKAENISLGVSAQRFRSLLDMFSSTADAACQLSYYEELATGGPLNPYDQSWAAAQYNRNLAPYVSQMKGVATVITTFPEASATTQVNDVTSQPSGSTRLLYQKYRSYEDLLQILALPAPEFLELPAITAVEGNSDIAMAVTISRESTDGSGKPVYFSMLLYHSYADTLTDGQFLIGIRSKKASVSFFEEQQTENHHVFTQSHASCEQELLPEGLTLTGYFPKNVPKLILFSPAMLLVIAIGTLTSGLMVWHFIGKRTQEFHELAARMSAGKDCKEIKLDGFRRHHLTFRHLLLLLLMVSALGSVSFCTSAFYLENRQLYNHYVQSVYQTAFNHVQNTVDSLLASCMESTKQLAINQKIQLLYEKKRDTESDEVLWNVQAGLGLPVSVCNNVALYSLQREFLASSVYGEHFLEMTSVQNSLRAFPSLQGRQSWYVYDDGTARIRIVILPAGIYSNVSGYGQILGYLLADYDMSTLRQLLDSASEEGCLYLIADSKGNTVLSTFPTEPQLPSPASPSTLPADSDRQLTIEGTLENDWQLISVVPGSLIRSQLHVLLLSFLFLMLLLYGILSSVCVAAEKNLTNALLALEQAMIQTGLKQKLVSYQPSHGHPDEVRLLGEQFNNIIFQVEEANRKALEAEKQSREFEINMLQSQINPHFLYNTLRTVQALILNQDSRSVEVIDRLIIFFRTSSHIESSVISLEAECRQVMSYLEIQQVRFADRFTFTCDIPQQLLHCKVISFCLQPLVENAFKHGIAHILSGGRLCLRAYQQGETLCITISDNGIGVTQEQLRQLNEKLAYAKYDSHIGILNVHQRIQLAFGPDYGLSIASCEGFQVTLTFPTGQEPSVRPSAGES